MASLRQRFEELLHMEWGAFCKLEKDKGSNVDDTVLCSLIRACADGDDIAAVKMAFDRADGLLETPIEIKVPKFYVRFVNAKAVEDSQKAIDAPKTAENLEGVKYDPASAKLRETLVEMRKMPRDVIRLIRLYKRRIEKAMDGGKPLPNDQHHPMVKSVIVANLLYNVQRGRFRAVELVFEQIDGKLTRTITLLGGADVFVDDYTILTAPVGSIKGKDGVYYAENQLMTTAWIRGFSQSQKGLETLAEGLEHEAGDR
jgi:hypothetical protein